MNKQFFFLVLICFLQTISFAQNSNASKPTLHLIGVFDTYSNDIRKAIQIDKKRVEKQYKYLAKDILNYEFKPYIFNGIKLLNRKNLLTRIEKLETRSNDIIIFHYSGHAHHYVPIFNFPRGRNLSETLRYLEVINKIKAKKSRFKLFLADCCGVVGKSTKGVIESKMLSDANLTVPQKRRCKKLFENPSHNVIALTGVSSEQKGYTNNEVGSYFTNAFFTEMTKIVTNRKEKLTWLNLFNKTKEATWEATVNEHADDQDPSMIEPKI